jgi:hypothetical protein
MSFREEVVMIASMFEGIDKTTIHRVFQANNFNVESTIDNLLDMNSESSPSPSSSTTDRSSFPLQQARASPVSATLAEARALERARQESQSGSRRAMPPKVGVKKWRNPLPEQFLRLPSSYLQTSSSSFTTLRDEELARMLQNEIFRQQLREDPLFNRLLAQEEESKARKESRARHREKGIIANCEAPNRPSGGSDEQSRVEAGNWFSGMSESVKRFISRRYRQNRDGRDGEERSLLSQEDPGEADEVAPLFDENADDGSGTGFEMHSVSSKIARSDKVNNSSPKQEPYSYAVKKGVRRDDSDEFGFL